MGRGGGLFRNFEKIYTPERLWIILWLSSFSLIKSRSDGVVNVVNVTIILRGMYTMPLQRGVAFVIISIRLDCDKMVEAITS